MRYIWSANWFGPVGSPTWQPYASVYLLMSLAFVGAVVVALPATARSTTVRTATRYRGVSFRRCESVLPAAAGLPGGLATRPFTRAHATGLARGASW